MRRDALLHGKPEMTTGDFHCRASTEGSGQIFPRVPQQEIGDHFNIHLFPPSLNFHLLQWQMGEQLGKETPVHCGKEKGEILLLYHGMVEKRKVSSPHCVEEASSREKYRA